MCVCMCVFVCVCMHKCDCACLCAFVCAQTDCSHIYIYRALFSASEQTYCAPVTCDDDDVRLHVLGCRVDILGTNCNVTCD